MRGREWSFAALPTRKVAERPMCRCKLLKSETLALLLLSCPGNLATVTRTEENGFGLAWERKGRAN